MKTRIATLLLLVSMLITATAFASEPVPATKSAKNEVTKLLAEAISYPAFASENNIECFVLVSMIINDDGTIDVDIANCRNCKMKNHVVKSIESFKNEELIKYAGQNVLVKVDFKLLD